jgi:hypothetical protein
MSSGTTPEAAAAAAAAAEAATRAREIFLAADKDGNGKLSHTELKRLLHADGALREQLQKHAKMPWKVRFLYCTHARRERSQGGQARKRTGERELTLSFNAAKRTRGPLCHRMQEAKMSIVSRRKEEKAREETERERRNGEKDTEVTVRGHCNSSHIHE